MTQSHGSSIPGAGLGGGARGSDVGSGGQHTGTRSDMGAASAADVGRASESPDAPTDSPGGTSASGLGADAAIGAELREPPEPRKGMAGRAAEENTQHEDEDNPEHVAGTSDSGVTPGYTP